MPFGGYLCYILNLTDWFVTSMLIYNPMIFRELNKFCILIVWHGLHGTSDMDSKEFKEKQKLNFVS